MSLRKFNSRKKKTKIPSPSFIVRLLGRQWTSNWLISEVSGEKKSLCTSVTMLIEFIGKILKINSKLLLGYLTDYI